MSVGRRSTAQRRAISEVLDAAEGFRTAQEIHSVLRRRGRGVGLTTVYRTLQALADGGEVDVLLSDDGEAMYRRCRSEDHHHHLVCRSCGRSVEVESPEVEKWARRTARRHGFRDITHTAEVFGHCTDCA